MSMFDIFYSFLEKKKNKEIISKQQQSTNSNYIKT